MELDNRCPLCGGTDCEIIPNTSEIWSNSDALYFNCKEGMQCTIHPSVWYGDEKEVIKRFHQIYLLMKEKPYLNINGMNCKYYFYYEEESIGKQPDYPQKKNVAELMKNYPKSFMDKMERSIYNLGKVYPIFGYIFSAENGMQHLLYIDSFDEEIIQTEIYGILDALVELGYLAHSVDNNYVYRISAKGWEKISEIEHQNEINNQGFIAMAFKEETKSISDSFKNAIKRCGYIPKRIDEKEHNKQIVPEILFEISRSKFVVVDITYPNYGAYYEAGYAEALGKEVIICCRDTDFKPHFDIAQKSAIVWKNEDDLEERLFRRIEATVGLN